jgi:tetratricopeptide (TPR) repeat protein
MRRFGLLLVPVTALLVVSCAYYNIFWMAEADYDKAVGVGGYDFWDPYLQPPLKGDSDRLVTSCIERCGKLILLYPKSKWVDDALLLMGNCFVIRGENQNALRKYDEILQLYATGQFAPMARYMKAYTLIRDGSTQHGTTLLTGLSEESKSEEVRERATFLLGRVALERGDCDEAVSFFETYLADYPRGTKAVRVRLHLAACLLDMGRPDRVVGVLEPLAKKEGDDGLQAALMMGEAYRAMDQNDRAIDIFTRLTETALQDTVKARAEMEIGRTMVARGEAEEAIPVLDKAAEMAAAAKGLQDEITFTKGLIDEKNLEDFDAAIAAYDAIAKSNSAYGVLAKKRSAALKAVEEFTSALLDTVPDSPDDEAEYRFMLGETYVDELGLREEGFREFKTVADSLPGTKFGPQAILRTASMLETQSDSLAGTYYRKVIEMLPGSVYANFARSQLGLPLVDVVIPEPDTLAVWVEGQVVGPFLPSSAPDSLPFVGPQLPRGPEPGRATSDTSMHGHRSRPDSTGARSRTPEPTGIRIPHREPPEAQSGDTTGTYAPADTTGSGRRQVP